MEEENLCSSPPDVTVTAVQLPQQALWTSIDHRRTNGGEEAIVCGAIEVQIDWAHEADQLSLEAGPGTPEEPGPGTAEEAGLETPEEAGPDTPEEAGLETPKEAGLETPEEAGPDTPEEAGLETPKEAGLETPEEVGLETPEEAGLETPEEGGLEAPEEAGLETPEELGLETPEHAGLETPEEAGLETPEEAGLETPEEVGLETPEEGGLEAPEKAGLETPEEAGPDSPEEAGLETPKEAGLETPEEVGLETPEDAGLETPEEAGLETPEDAGLETPEELGLETPEEAGLETPEEAGLETPEDAGLETPEELGLETPEEAGLETPEEAAQWEQTVWQLTCTGAPLSFATVRWDVPDPSAATPSLVTDIGSANGPIPGGVTSLDRTSPSPQRSQGVNADLFIRQGRGEDDGFDYLALDSNPELTGNASEPCGTADVQEPPTQEREDPTHKLIESNNGVPLRAVLEEEEVPSANSRPVTVNSLHLLDVTAVSQGEADSFVDLKPQEEPGQPCCVLLTGPSDSEEEQTSARGVEDEGEEQERINVSCTEESKEAKFAICLSYVEFSGELSQTEDARETVNSDKPTDRPDIGSHEEPGMCVEVDRKADPERSEAADGVEESSARAAGHSDRRENSPEATALIEGSEEGETTLRRAELPPQARQGASERLEMAEEPKTGESQATQHLSAEPGVAREAADEAGGGEEGSAQPVAAREERAEPPEGAAPLMNGDAVNGEMARRLAERLRGLDGIQRADVVKHLDKDNDFSRAVGEEYLKLFDFTGQTLDHGLRSFLKVVVLIGETQERERVLQHFACRFHHCNPDSFTSSESVLALTCALMLLNTDLHGQNVGKSMSSAKFVSNLDGMNEGENFSKDLLKSLYNSIKSEPLQWAVDEEELKSSVLVDEDAAEDAPLRSKSNPFQDVPHDKTASVVKQGFLQRKLHADIDGKRTPWGKRGWKTFYGVVRGMVLYLQKDDYRRDQPIDEEVVSLHHSLAEQAADYTKKPHVFRLQTADWRVLLFQASSKLEMHSWISRINLVSALHSSPPFPAAVGSQRRFCRPILPSSQSGHTPERQLQSYAGTLKSFKDDLSYLQENLPEGKRAKAKELEEHRVRAEYLHHEMCRYEIYIQGLEAWRSVTKAVGSAPSVADLNRFDKAVCAFSPEEEEEEDEGRLKKSHSSPSLELEIAPPALIKVRRNISERRTYRKTIIPRWNKEV